MAEFTYEGVEFRIHDRQVQRRRAGERRWQPAPLGTLAREYAAGEGPWPWLRENGVTRPSPSGYTPEAEQSRSTTKVTLRLEPRDADRLTEIAEAEGTTKSGVVTRWIRGHK